jgi:cell division protein WhiA
MAHRLGPDEPSFDWLATAPHCRTAFLRGLFLGCGSLSLAAGRTHLEFVVPPAELPTVARWLSDVGLPASSRVRRQQGVLTWKGTETVIGFLRRAGARTAAMELEALLVRRSLRGHLNRVVNAESANLRRSVTSSRRQLATIQALVEAGELKRLPRPARAVAVARLHAPEATFSELAAGLGTSRALVQRAFAEIEERALRHGEPPSGQPQPAAGR